MEHDKLSTRSYRSSPLARYARNLLRKVNRGIDEFKFFADGDRVCVAVSGGKDSLSLLHLLIEHKRFYNVKYDIEVVHIVSDYIPQGLDTREYIRSFCAALGIPCSFPEISVTTDEKGEPCDPSCFWCAWKRREALFSWCVEHGFNKLALAHHADDVAETTLLNLIYHGTLETMLPSRVFFDGKFTLVRPLFYVRERDLVRFARLAGFQTCSCECPNSETGKRHRMKEIVRELSKESRLLHPNLWRAARLWWEAYGDHPLHTGKKDERINLKSEI
ncbi:MAG: tRNA 2-thiocytidine biosynthesis TtcA family protein [Candidatus Latescibacterota bacterium]